VNRLRIFYLETNTTIVSTCKGGFGKNTFLKIQGQDPTDNINITIKSNHDDGLEKQ
jgi:hypothetical protein